MTSILLITLIICSLNCSHYVADWLNFSWRPFDGKFCLQLESDYDWKNAAIALAPFCLTVFGRNKFKIVMGIALGAYRGGLEWRWNVGRK